MKHPARKKSSARTGNNRQGANRFRIIGGRWRGRKLSFLPLSDLRPTSDRSRETLFNWLAPVIQGARCVDLFAGSGALGIEALSRGAGGVTFVDSEARAIHQIKENLALLSCEHYQARPVDAIDWLKQCAPNSIDIIFLDPPFRQPQLLDQALQQLAQYPVLAPGAHVYLELPCDQDFPALPAHWTLLRHKQAGQVQYALARIEEE